MWIMGESLGEWDPLTTWYLCYEYFLANCTDGTWNYYVADALPVMQWQPDGDASISVGSVCASADADWDFISFDNHLHPIKFGPIDGTMIIIDSQLGEVWLLFVFE